MPLPPDVVRAVIIPPGDAARAQRVSGISGLAYDRANRSWIAVSDDRQAPRWFVCHFGVQDHALHVDTSRPVMAHPPPVVNGLIRVPDFEAIVILPNGELLIASEGERRAGRLFPTSIMRFRRDGSYIADVPIPERYLPSTRDGVEYGLRDGHGFEGLALSADHTRLWTVAETALEQDDEPASDRKGARLRFLEFAVEGTAFRAERELIYPLDRVTLPAALGPGAEVIDQGVSELTTLDDGTLLSLERAFVRDRTRQRSANIIRIFRLDLAGADEVQDVDSLRRVPAARPIRKTLVRDLTTLEARLPSRLATLENFEAMAPGPLPGDTSLVLMSDDNFSVSQVTAALLLRIGPFMPDRPGHDVGGEALRRGY